MSITRVTYWVLECDCFRPGCHDRGDGPKIGPSAPTSGEARDAARADGWKVTESGRLAYCPHCRRRCGKAKA